MSETDAFHVHLWDQHNEVAKENHKILSGFGRWMGMHPESHETDDWIMRNLAELLDNHAYRACEHVARTGWMHFTGPITWYIGPNVFVCHDCLWVGVLATISDNRQDPYRCDICRDHNPSGVIRNVILHLRHIIAFAAQGASCECTNHLH